MPIEPYRAFSRNVRLVSAIIITDAIKFKTTADELRNLVKVLSARIAILADAQDDWTPQV
jgi:hypothetical protein